MSETIIGELDFFLYAALTGIILSAVYDVFRILRRVYAHGTFWVAVEDFIYWLGSALFISYILLKENNGTIRWFFVLAIPLGMLVYNLTISRYLVGILSKLFNKAQHIVEKILKLLFKPFIFLWNKTRFLRKNIKKALKKSWKTIKIGIRKK